MKVSLNWIKQFTDVDLSVDELVGKIGAQLGAVEEVIDLGARYKGVVVAKVVTCVDHDNSDHLHVCKIDDGGKTQGVERDENGHVQVVCGAPNVREGLTVAWLPPGSTVPATYDHDPFVLEARDIRGQKSNGMLASPKELALGDNHEGILEIDTDAAPGTPFADAYELNDYIIDIENKMFTHRPDLFGELGVAREIAGITHKAFTSPEWYLNQPPIYEQGSEQLPLEVFNQATEVVPRFMAIAIKDVEVKPSPVWLQTYLNRVGIRPINNVVDITNYMMMLTGQPLHAYDYDKVRAQDRGSETATLCARYPHSGEKVMLLNGKEVEPRAEAIVIATASKAIGIGGVMGGADTEVDENTKNIILECASFDMYSIRRTSMAHGLFTDAVTRFNKGQSPLQTDRVMAKAVEMLRELAHGESAGKPLNDVKPLPGRADVTVGVQFINERLGLKLSGDEMAQLLRNVEFGVDVQNDELTVHIPFWRTDIEIREDVVEEVGRLYGYDHLPLELPHRDMTPTPKDALLEAKSHIRRTLSAAGANEVLTYSFVHGNLLDKVGQDKAQAYQLSNALSPDLQYYRLSLVPSLLEKVHPNIKAGYDDFVLYEIGKVHTKERPGEDGLPSEDEYTALVVAASSKASKTGAAYYEARKYLVDLVGVPLKFQPLTAEAQTFAVVQPYQPGRAAMVSTAAGKFLGIIGEFKSSVTAKLKLPTYCAGFELDTTALAEVLGSGRSYVELPKYPKVEQDISLKVPADLSYQELYDFVWDELSKVQPEHTLPSLGPLDMYQGDDKQHKNITLRFTIASYSKTMKAEEVNAMLDTVAAAAHEKFGAERL
ncbi:MAG TPA: phenylalanine--tRNA ligase subunit beta [Candidatus Saccharimonadales bacterium]|nr:phenylalanine--tRNA ligase subunit beta [Candidatus Saccharimonadales bacterium]